MYAELSSQLTQIYARRFDAQVEYRNRVWEVLVDSFFQRFLKAEDAVLDLGCGYGQFINHARARTKYGMDLNPHSREMLTPETEFFEQDCGEPWPLADGSLDVIFSSNFFEHLADKPSLERTIREAARCLKAGGRIVVMGPNVRHVPGAYWDFWDHHIPLTELSVAELLAGNGFRIESAISRFLPYTAVNRREAPMILVKAYLRFPPAWRFWGHQFLVTAHKIASPEESVGRR